MHFNKKPMVSLNRQVSDIALFKNLLAKSRNPVIITGAGLSAESGVPTFRGEGGFWRKYAAQDLASPEAFDEDPGLVWEFYHYRRELVRQKSPNAGHEALAAAEKLFTTNERSFTIITQNVDGLLTRAGCKNVIELHGNLYQTRCIRCSDVLVNEDSPICAALSGRGSPVFDPELHQLIPEEELPHCTKLITSLGKTRPCNGLLRPNIVWFGESLSRDVLRRVDVAMASADICVVVGTSAVVYPAAGFAPTLAARNVPVAEINVEETPVTSKMKFFFKGMSGVILPQLFDSLKLL